MAQTNDEQLFRKVVSKPDFRNTFSNIEKKEILDNRSAPEAWHIKELMLQIAREARLDEQLKIAGMTKEEGNVALKEIEVQARLAALDDLQNLFREKGFIEKLAYLEHDRWSRWEIYRSSRLIKLLGEGGSDAQSKQMENWQRKRNLSYDELTEHEKISDRAEVDRTIGLILAELEALRKKAST